MMTIAVMGRDEMTEVYEVQLNSQGAPNFATAQRVVRFVRCRDCIHWDRDGVADVDGEKLCLYYSEGNCSYDFTTAQDDYCSGGERRNG